jgi:hypothetical protein
VRFAALPKSAKNEFGAKMLTKMAKMAKMGKPDIIGWTKNHRLNILF